MADGVRRFSNGVRGPGDELSVGLQQDGATTWLRSRDRGGCEKHKTVLSGEPWGLGLALPIMRSRMVDGGGKDNASYTAALANRQPPQDVPTPYRHPYTVRNRLPYRTVR
ncbi:hypothetical protein MSG28_014038 [Choristoneura fumiferana]|uniref:Uncharacterized protein n=1 Tax=Choristoneura fumiferana TaxID=7141 RepID=A0ACC0JFV1_CHOFU|nr:hypothetical protein MSG28_014038 [Choristoneura fumiferana]